MQWTIPGTVLQGNREDAVATRQQFDGMFFGGGMVLSQVSAITGLEGHTIQNWVKRGFLPPPEKKRYSLRQLCRILNINTLKNVMPLERICSLLSYVNGNLRDEGDDLIDDTQLYFLFLSLAARSRQAPPEERAQLLQEALLDYREPVAGAKERVKNVLSVMLTAYFAAILRQEAEQMLREMKIS